MNEREKRWLSEQVDTEDVEAMTIVRRGASSGLAPRGRRQLAGRLAVAS